MSTASPTSKIPMKKSLLFVVLLCFASAAAATDTPNDVKALIARGDYGGAEAMLRQAVSEHPASAKAHYVLAEVLAHRGDIGEARAEATMAATLDPDTHFTKPATFQAFERELDTALAPAAARRTASAAAIAPTVATATGRGSSHLVGLVSVGGIALLLAIFLMRRKRDTAPTPGGLPYPPPVDAGAPYGSYAGNTPYAAPPAPRSGVGAAVAAGLGGVAAGMLLEDALRDRSDGAESRAPEPVLQPAADPTGRAYDELRDRPVDMGNDDDSWGDASLSDTGSGDDDGW